MDLKCLLLMVLGAGVLSGVRGAASRDREIEPELFRRSFPGLDRRFPAKAEQYGRVRARMTLAVGAIVGAGVIVVGAIIAF